MEPYWTEMFGNPHSEEHSFGWDARRGVETARSQVAELIGADDDEIYFVSGATESCNLALRGVAFAAPQDRSQIISLATEHSAVLDTIKWLGCHGYEVQLLPVMKNGVLDLTTLESVLSERTLLVSAMLANNEIGVIQPIAEISDLCKSVGAIVHTDATQAVGRIGVDVDDLGVDLLSFSAHKIYGPNGVGALYIRSRPGLQLEPLMTGGSQEGGIRPGTVATPLVVGFGRACEIVSAEWDIDARKMKTLSDHLLTSLSDEFPDLRIFGDTELRIPGNLNVGVPGVLGESVVAAVSEEIAISTGAACASGSPDPSHVLLSLGVGHEAASTGVRISLGRFTTREQVGIAVRVLQSAFTSLIGW